VTPELLVVCHPEDLVLEFLSVLDSPVALRAAVAGIDTVVDLPPVGLPRRLALVAGLLEAPAVEPTQESVRRLTAGVRRSGPVWTHSPADERLDRAKVAAWATFATGQSRCSVGISAHLRFVADSTVGLSPVQLSRKLDWLATYRTPQIEAAGGPRGIGIAAVADVERYVNVSAAQAGRLFSVRHDWHPDVDLGAEPWDFAASPYERQRLRATAQWVGKHLPRPATLVEAGACEGALTDLLLDDGFTVDAQEPVADLRERLQARAAGRAGLTTGGATVQDLALAGGPRGDAYLLMEMLDHVAELSLLDGLGTDLLFVSLSPVGVRSRVLPWLSGHPVWEHAETVELVAPRFELVVDGLAYHRKLGSTGVLARRR
jgi:hypothetical protein